MERLLKRLPNVFAWEGGGQWHYSESKESAAPAAIEVHRYEASGRIVLYRPFGDSGVLIWDAQQVE